MNHLRMLPAVVGLFFAAVFLSSCADPQAPTTASEVPRITPQELKERLDSGDAILIGDTRSKMEYDLKRIPGAISLPENQVEDHLDDLPRDQEIILYCT